MKILVITTIYPEPDDGKLAPTTPVVHNFAKEWVKQGHEVVAIHNSNKFLLPFYYIPKKVLAKLSGKVGFNIKLIKEQRNDSEHFHDGVHVYRCNIMKYIPFGSYTTKQIEKQYQKICSVLDDLNFKPDIIIAHAENPQIWQLYHLKKRYPDTRTAIVLHGIHYLDRKGFEEWKDVYLLSIDKVGFRSKALYIEAVTKIGYDRDFFICPSGIADIFVKDKPDFDNKFQNRNIKEFIFVGQLTPRKHADKVIIALAKKYPEKNFHLQILGNGGEMENFKNIARQYNVEKQVEFYGQVNHSDVLKAMSQSQFFIMVSEQEVFGLVYFEAMSQGCIAIASKNEGMDGIIHDGENGFLCRAGSTDALTEVLDNIDNMSQNDLKEIAKNGYLLAKDYTESAVAKKYLQNVVGS